MVSSEYIATIPRIPYCADELPGSVIRRRAEEAIFYRNLSPNPPHCKMWLTFDLDHADSIGVIEKSGLPSPTYVAVNRINGHAHAGYQLESPVHFHDRAKLKPQQFLLAIDRGFRRRLHADWSYSGFLTKNPLHPDWLVIWQNLRLHRLDEMNDCLAFEEKRFRKSDPLDSGLGRNVSLFDAVRKLAYGDVLNFKKTGQSMGDFSKWVFSAAESINRNYGPPLMACEVRSVAKSITRFAWDKFTAARFSQIQSFRGSKPWKKRVPLSRSKPWEDEGISRASWYRRKALSSSDMDTVSTKTP